MKTETIGRIDTLTETCMDIDGTLQLTAIKQRTPSAATNSLGMSQRSVLPVSFSILSPVCDSDKSSISQTELCPLCGETLISFGTCRLYTNGWTFDLRYCKPCKAYDFQSPTMPGKLAAHQAYTLTQIFSETGGRL